VDMAAEPSRRDRRGMLVNPNVVHGVSCPAF
jgi:hypothetical protein